MPQPHEKITTGYHDYREVLHQAEDLLNQAVADGLEPLLAFSGGKDSIVACHIAKGFGFHVAVCDESLVFLRLISEVRDIANHLGLEVTYVDRFGRDYTLRNPKWLFPPVPQQSAMYSQRQQTTVRRFAADNGYGSILYGRRLQENTVPGLRYQTKDEVWQLHPIRNWSLGQIWSYIRDFEIPYPSIYDHRLGEVYGNTPWAFIAPAWLTDTDPDEWALIADYDLETITELAEWYPQARQALSNLELV